MTMVIVRSDIDIRRPMLYVRFVMNVSDDGMVTLNEAVPMRGGETLYVAKGFCYHYNRDVLDRINDFLKDADAFMDHASVVFLQEMRQADLDLDGQPDFDAQCDQMLANFNGPYQH
jgi:hypothetical protein